MTEDPTEAALRGLEAERLRPSRDERVSDPWRELIGLLDRLLTDPGPPDPPALLSGPDSVTTPDPKESP